MRFTRILPCIIGFGLCNAAQAFTWTASLGHNGKKTDIVTTPVDAVKEIIVPGTRFSCALQPQRNPFGPTAAMRAIRCVSKDKQIELEISAICAEDMPKGSSTFQLKDRDKNYALSVGCTL